MQESHSEAEADGAGRPVQELQRILQDHRRLRKDWTKDKDYNWHQDSERDEASSCPGADAAVLAAALGQFPIQRAG